MKLLKLLPLMLLLLVCNSCKEGAESLSELSVSIFNALKASNFNALLKTAPSDKSMANYLELYEFNKFKDPTERKAEAANRTKVANAQLKKEFDATVASLKDRIPDWNKAKLTDYKYQVNDTKEGYHQAQVRLLISANSKVSTINCTALQVADRWFLVPGLNVVN